MVTYTDFENWKADPVTKKFFESVQERIEQVKDTLVQDAGKEPADDRYYCGYARACYDILDTEFKDED